MNTSSILLALLFLQAPHQSLPGERDLGTVSDPDGASRTYLVSYARLGRAPSWDPDSGPPPLPMDRAVEVGRKWLAQQNPKFEGFRPSNFQLMCISEGSGKRQWVWTVHFEARLGDRWLGGLGFEAYILMDGTVVEPTVSAAPLAPK